MIEIWVCSDARYIFVRISRIRNMEMESIFILNTYAKRNENKQIKDTEKVERKVIRIGVVRTTSHA